MAVNFSHPKKDVIQIELHHGARKNVATLRTVRTLINNLIIGVTKGFKYKMRYVYAHFPINVNVEKNSETGLFEVEIRYVLRALLGVGKLGFGTAREEGRSADGIHRNFIGEKIVRRVVMQPGVDVEPSKNQKDELQLYGNSLENVSQSAADIQQICRVRNKDIRKVRFQGGSFGEGENSADNRNSSWTVCTFRRRATSMRNERAWATFFLRT